ncbi:MAG TPA: hypothetical protein PLZ36_03220 [Armatimonadota bacterium]|nr:hypothetical protein [Armatimonadota bacterium]
MQRNLLVVILIVFTLAPLIAGSPAPRLKTLKASDVTITYPADLEAQAQQLGAAAIATANLRQEHAQEIRAYAEHAEQIAERIAVLLGQPALKAKLHKPMRKYGEITRTAFTRMAYHWRIYHAADIPENGIQQGPMRYFLDKQSGRYSLQLTMNDASAVADFKKLCMPYVVRADGTYARSKPLNEALEADDHWLIALSAAMIHEASEPVIVNDLRCYHPFARWFNEGLANWVTLTIVRDFFPKRLDLVRDHLTLTPDDPRRAKVNLYTWPQLSYMMPVLASEEAALGATNYGCATELVMRIFEGQPDDAPARVLQRLSRTPNPDSRTICRALDSVTKKDSFALLLEYVPAESRNEIIKPRIPELNAQARQAKTHGDYAGLMTAFSTMLSSDPAQYRTRLNLAWAMRKANQPMPMVDQQLLLAAAFRPFGFDLREMIAQDTDMMFIFGRLYQVIGDTKAARQIYLQILADDPRFTDAKHALAELGAKQR